MSLSLRKIKMVIYIIIAIGVLIISWKILLALHFSNIQKSIKQYAGDGKIEYILAPPVPFSGFHDGVRIVFPEIVESSTGVEYSLKMLPAGRVYHLLFRVPKETNYINKFPGNIKIEVYRNGELIQIEDSAKTILRNSYTIHNEFYFDSEKDLKLFRKKTDTGELRLKIIYSGEKSIQAILQNGGEL